MDRRETLNIANAKIIFRNFAGERTAYNREGDRNFCVIIEDEEDARRLAEDGWNIKLLKPRDPEDTPKHYLQVKVSFDNIPPRAYLIAGENKTLLNEASIDCLDYSDLVKVDLVITPYMWDVNGKTGIKAYLKIGYFTIDEDPFASQYNF